VVIFLAPLASDFGGLKWQIEELSTKTMNELEFITFPEAGGVKRGTEDDGEMTRKPQDVEKISHRNMVSALESPSNEATESSGVPLCRLLRFSWVVSTRNPHVDTTQESCFVTFRTRLIRLC
jgi:hypothetical protein